MSNVQCPMTTVCSTLYFLLLLVVVRETFLSMKQQSWSDSKERQVWRFFTARSNSKDMKVGHVACAEVRSEKRECFANVQVGGLLQPRILLGRVDPPKTCTIGFVHFVLRHTRNAPCWYYCIIYHFLTSNRLCRIHGLLVRVEQRYKLYYGTLVLHARQGSHVRKTLSVSSQWQRSTV
jgi:hypothetical protein